MIATLQTVAWVVGVLWVSCAVVFLVFALVDGYRYAGRRPASDDVRRRRLELDREQRELDAGRWPRERGRGGCEVGRRGAAR